MKYLFIRIIFGFQWQLRYNCTKVQNFNAKKQVVHTRYITTHLFYIGIISPVYSISISELTTLLVIVCLLQLAGPGMDSADQCVYGAQNTCIVRLANIYGIPSCKRPYRLTAWLCMFIYTNEQHSCSGCMLMRLHTWDLRAKLLELVHSFNFALAEHISCLNINHACSRLNCPQLCSHYLPHTFTSCDLDG